MSNDPSRQFDVLFEAVPIGPVTSKNRFYQTPHGNGCGFRDPSAMIEMRRVKAAGGWGVVCTEQTEIHPSSDMSPFIEMRAWGPEDRPVLGKVVEAIHEHGALAAIELSHSGLNTANLSTRLEPLGPAHLPVTTEDLEPIQARAMTLRDIRHLRQWQRRAALDARDVGFDLVYVYAGLFLSLPHQFLSRRYNTRSDEYGGSLANRARLLCELVEETKAAVGDRCAVPVRITLDEHLGPDMDTLEELFDVIGRLPDLFDVVIGGMNSGSGSARFEQDDHGRNEAILRRVKACTPAPVVSVGFVRSPPEMARLIRDGVVDFIGAARPSIADPFLPRKIESGRSSEIRPCIACNICVASDYSSAPVRCTQNPTFSEEWRRGWHPEEVPRRHAEMTLAVVGAGPAGMECARVLGRRGYDVRLYEASTELGGRVAKEALLPGLQRWIAVRDYRAAEFARLGNVEVRRASRVSAESLLTEPSANGRPRHIVIATGARWRRDGVGRHRDRPLTVGAGARILTPDDLPVVSPLLGRVLIYDDDHYYLGSVLAEVLARTAASVTYVTPVAEVAAWTHRTMEQRETQRRLLDLGVHIVPHRILSRVDAGGAELQCIFTGRISEMDQDSVVLVTARLPEDALAAELDRERDRWSDAGVHGVTVIGDARAPGQIVHAVFSGHAMARTFPDHDGALDHFERREMTP